MKIDNAKELKKIVDKAVESVKITDVHTHLFTPDFGPLLLWGFDELVTYHYLIAETMRIKDIPYSGYWGMSKKDQADLIWKTLFLENSPISEACRGVLTVLEKLGLDVGSRDVESYRRYFDGLTIEEYIDKVLELAGISSLVMTNDPFVNDERIVWERGIIGDSRFKAALRIDPLLNNWEISGAKLKEWGYDVQAEPAGKTLDEIRRFLSDWIDRIKPVYMAASLPPSFRVPENSVRSVIVEKCIIPVSAERNVPFAMMIGVKKRVNPGLGDAGDSVGKADIDTIEYLCSAYPRNKFMVTLLSRENQHELCVAGRKFRNLLIFGCWWFLNNPSLIDEITRMRFELLGCSTVMQHSDARILDQLIYKWSHSRKIIAGIMYEKYLDALNTGWTFTENEITRDVEKVFGGYFQEFLKREF